MQKSIPLVLGASLIATTPALAGASPESFARTMRAVAAMQASDVETVEGEIVSIAEDRASFRVRVGPDGTLRTIKIDDHTSFMLDGTASDRDSALKSARHAKVSLKDGIAVKVEVRTKAAAIRR